LPPLAFTSQFAARRPHIHCAVRKDDWDLGLFDFLQYWLPTGFDHWRKRNYIHALRNESFERLDLVFLFLLRVGKYEFNAAFGRLGLD
jgi:hypothetical protein